MRRAQVIHADCFLAVPNEMPATIDMGGRPALFSLSQGSSFQLQNALLYNLPIGPVKMYPDGLLTSQMWSFDVLPAR